MSTDLGAFVVVAFVLVGVDIVGVLSRLAVVVVFGLALGVGEKVGGLGIPLMHAPLVCPPKAPSQHAN
jgi:hypothetical protein